MVVIGLQPFKEDPNNENLTRLEHVQTYRRNLLSQYPNYGLSSQGDNNILAPIRQYSASTHLLSSLQEAIYLLL